MEKKCQDEVSSLKRLNNQLKQALNDKDKMLLEATRLNMDLQSKLLDQFDELKSKADAFYHGCIIFFYRLH